MKSRPRPASPPTLVTPGHRLGSEYMDARSYLRAAPRQPARSPQVETSDDGYHGSNASLFMDERPADPQDP